MSKTTKNEEKEVVMEDAEKKTMKFDVSKTPHQIITLTVIHLLYIAFEAANAFNPTWISVIIYGVISLGTIGFIFLQKENAKYLIPIPFISLIIVGGILGNLEGTITITVIFVAYCIFYYTLVFLYEDITQTIITILFSAVTLFILTTFMKFNQGFVAIGKEYNVISFLWLFWAVATSAVVIKNKEKQGLNLLYTILLIFMSSIGPVIRPEGSANPNVFTLICGVILLGTAVISIIIAVPKEEFNIGRFIGNITIIEIGFVVFSYTFNFAFSWIANRTTKASIVDFGLLLPLVLYTMTILVIKYYPREKDESTPRTYSLFKSKELLNKDMILWGTYLSFIIMSQVMYVQEYGYNFINGLVISLIFFSATIPLTLRFSTTSSLLLTFAFLGLTLYQFTTLQKEYNLIILMAISAAIIIFAVLNELFLTGEPLTTTLTLAGSLILMVTSQFYFSINFEAQFLYSQVVWAGIGLFLFTIGLIFNRLFLRRTGLIIVLLDVVKTIIEVLMVYIDRDDKWVIGIAFMILAIVIMTCIFLFRWSEKREKSQQEVTANLE
ncbi:MAG: hypothetical protein FK732_02065 [Asgard group archaeon]|nr:hypothetical protein [Asgard group archaeon]